MASNAPSANFSVPHAATFRSNTDITRGDAQKNIENIRRQIAFDAARLTPQERRKRILAETSTFKASKPDFLEIIASDSCEQSVKGEEVLFFVGQICNAGTTPLYVLLDGNMIVENRLEVCVAKLGAGEIFGEGGALGLTEERTATVRAAKGKGASFMRIEAVTLEAALTKYPEERDRLEEFFYDRQAAGQEFERKREEWVRQVVVPALTHTQLLNGCPDEFLADVGASLNEKTYRDCQTIAVCGDVADSMLVLLEGTAEIEAKSAAKISLLKEGACIGEVAALDIFPCRTATIKAVGRCRVLAVTKKALSRAIENSPEDMVRVAFARLVQSRHEQVQKGLPMCALPTINARPDDVCVRAVALQAERIDLQPGQVWQPLSDDEPCGPHFSILVKGKALLETCEEHRLVTGLLPGSLFPEGMCAEFNTHIRALTHCEGYRVRQSDFLVAVYSMPSAQEWFFRFRLLDKKTRAHLHSRLSAVRAVTDHEMPHPSDDEINRWKTRRQKAIERAQKIKVGIPVPKLPSPHNRSLELSQSTSSFKDESGYSSMSRIASAPQLSRQLSKGGALSHVVPVTHNQQASVDGLRDALHLPRLQTAN